MGVTRRCIRARSCYPPRAGVVICHGARRVWHMFLQSRYKVCWALCVSRYKVDRSHGFIPRNKFLGVYLCSVGMQSVSKSVVYPGAGFKLRQMRESRCRNHYKSVLVAETKAKTVTSSLIIPSVLVKVFLSFCHVGLKILVQSFLFFLFFCPLEGSVFY